MCSDLQESVGSYEIRKAGCGCAPRIKGNPKGGKPAVTTRFISGRKREGIVPGLPGGRSRLADPDWRERCRTRQCRGRVGFAQWSRACRRAGPCTSLLRAKEPEKPARQSANRPRGARDYGGRDSVSGVLASGVHRQGTKRQASRESRRV